MFLLDALFYVLFAALDVFWWAVVLAVVVNLLVAFQILDTRNRLVWTIGDFLHRLTEPALRPIRRRLPHLGGVDLSPRAADRHLRRWHRAARPARLA